MAKESRATAGMGGGHKSGGKKSGGKKHLHEMRIRHAKSGGYIVTHHTKPQPGAMADDPEEHIVSDPDQLSQHVAENMAPPEPEAAGGAGPSPAPTPGM